MTAANVYRVTLVNDRTGRVHVNTVYADTVPEAARIAHDISGHAVLDVVLAPTAAEAATRRPAARKGAGR